MSQSTNKAHCQQSFATKKPTSPSPGLSCLGLGENVSCDSYQLKKHQQSQYLNMKLWCWTSKWNQSEIIVFEASLGILGGTWQFFNFYNLGEEELYKKIKSISTLLYLQSWYWNRSGITNHQIKIFHRNWIKIILSLTHC